MFRLNVFVSYIFILGRFAIVLISAIRFDCDGHLRIFSDECIVFWFLVFCFCCNSFDQLHFKCWPTSCDLFSFFVVRLSACLVASLLISCWTNFVLFCVFGLFLFCLSCLYSLVSPPCYCDVLIFIIVPVFSFLLILMIFFRVESFSFCSLSFKPPCGGIIVSWVLAGYAFCCRLALSSCRCHTFYSSA